jgi:Domain of unknown function (DUF4157)
MNASATIAHEARSTGRSADGSVASANHHVPVRTAAPRSRPSRIPIGASADGAAQIPAVALRPAQVPATGPVAMSAMQREQLTGSGAPSAEHLGMARAAASVLDVVGRGTGQALDEGVRADMETRLGADMSRVRVHTDAAAGRSALAIRARAYTVGDDIVFGPGAYAPATAEGRRTLAHELAHVQQQRKGPVSGTDTGGGIAVSDPDDSFERQAQAVADQALSGPAHQADSAAPIACPVAGVVVQRNGGPPLAPAPPAVDLKAKIRGEAEIIGPIYVPHIIAAIHAAPVAERQAALADAPLRQLLRNRLDRADCLAVMTSLLEGSQNWVNPPSNDFFQYFVTDMRTGTLPNAASMNCWESILYGAYLSGQIDQRWIQHFYTNALGSADPNATVWATLGWSAALPVYSATVKPTAGQLLFYHTAGPVPDHVALSLGGDEAISLWSQPHNDHHAQRIHVTDLHGTVHIGNPPW